MDSTIKNEFIKLCINEFSDTSKDRLFLQRDQEIYGRPPESIVILIGSCRNSIEWRPISQKESAYRYNNDGFAEVDINTRPDHTENGMFFKEAYAELCIEDDSAAFMMIMFGKRYVRCYKYNIIQQDGKICFSDKTLMWIS